MTNSRNLGMRPKPATVIDVLTAARKLISNEDDHHKWATDGWARGASALTTIGEHCDPCYVHARAWSIAGAIERTSHCLDGPFEAAIDALARAVPKSRQGPSPLSTIQAFNNAKDTGLADVLALFDRAIEE